MIIPGRVALQRRVITHLLSAEHQAQPCGIDLTLKRVINWSSSGTIDFDNTQRKTAGAIEIPIMPRSKSSNFVAEKSTSITERAQRIPETNKESLSEYVDLCCGSYLVEFSELVDMPLDLMGQILVRSSLFRSGALIHAGVMDTSKSESIFGHIL